MSVPPGSRAPAPVQTALLLRDPVGFFRGSREKYGPVFSARFIGLPRIAYVATPELADLVLRTDRDIGEAGTARKPFLEPLVGPESVICLEGAAWERERRRLAPAFHGSRVTRWQETIAGIVEAEVATWPFDEPFALRPRLQHITLDVMMNVVFGLRGAAPSRAGEALDVVTERRRRLETALRGVVDVASTPALAFVPARVGTWLEQAPLARQLPRNPIAGFLALKATLDELLLEEISSQRRARAAPGADVLAMLADIPDMSESQIRDELITLLEAGHETTATGLAWCFERLLRHPDVLDRVRQAVDQGDDRYLDAVVKETLRVRPVLNDAPRMLTAPLRIGSFEIPPGWYVAPAMPLVHTDPTAYPEPDRFSPERFLTGKHTPSAWIPFGGSRRLCLGIQLALLEMRTVLTEVVRRVDLRPDRPRPEKARLRGVTLVPERHTRVLARARTHRAASAALDRP
jgi:cytochrome P450 family 135